MIPAEYLEMSLRSVVALSLGRGHPRNKPCEVSTIVAAVHALEARIEKQDAEHAADDAESLARAFEQLTVELPEK
jgi:hypothetical protein